MNEDRENPPSPPAPPPPAPASGKDARTWAIFCHLGGLASLVGPAVGNIIVPLVIWLLKRSEYPFVDRHGKEAVNFQISVTIYAVCCIPLAFILVGFPLLLALAVFDIIMIVKAAMAANNSEEFRYPLTIRFLK